ncbi:MAG: hypothetical protein AAF266_11370, partial [Planctomycetota bacterium]
HRLFSVLLVGLAATASASHMPVASDLATVTLADYTTIPDGRSPAFSLNGTTVTGSADITSGDIGGIRGLGVFGGTFPPTTDLSLDLGETLTIDYGQLVTGVKLQVVDIDPPGNVRYAFEAFDEQRSLGVVEVPRHMVRIETINLSALVANEPFTRVSLTVIESAPAGLQIQRTSFTPIPEPLTLALLGIAAAGLPEFTRVRAR